MREETKDMAIKMVELKANERVFVGLSKQNMLFHQCIFELCDNALAAGQDGIKTCVSIAFEPIEDLFTKR